jgi:hypothetical protein
MDFGSITVIMDLAGLASMEDQEATMEDQEASIMEDQEALADRVVISRETLSRKATVP